MECGGSGNPVSGEDQMPDSFVDAREIFEKVKREAEAESGDFLSFAPFTMDSKEGLFVTVEKRRGKDVWDEDVWLSAPFEIISRVRDPQSHGWARLLQWRDDDGIVHQHSVADYDLHGDGAALCATLANGGLKIATGSNRQHFVSYLNGAVVKARVTIVPRTGWHNVDKKKVFALPGEGGINLRGPSSIGKTTLLSAAASVWGRGDERGFIRTWRGTSNGIEAAATQFSDTFLPLDEIGVASGHEVGNVIYSIAGGVGKQRANRYGSAKLPNTWRIFILSTGEISIADKIREGGKRARAGQEIRVLDLNADAGKGFGVFDTGKDPEQLARNLRQASITFYGTAGPAFIKAIIAKTDDVAAIAQESLDTFREQVAANVQSGQVLRAANRIGLVAVAGELAIQLGVLRWPTGSVNEAAADVFRNWHAERGGSDPAEVRAAIEQIRGILERYGDSRFDAPNPTSDSRPVNDRLG